MSDESIWIQITDGPIQLATLQQKLAEPDSGAHGWFVGVTRRTTNQRVTNTLSYEAHRPMALKEMEAIARDAKERFKLFRVVMVHRLGDVPIGEASVVVGCSSAHRPATFDALPWIMDRLKADVPIWKQEHYRDGSTEWIHPENSDGKQA